ncbi:MAG: hypothetical protein DDG58_07130 [Ardenticatenia bacterium]|nr:MAG: hypothetical protein DDG58_07130 [Ardenticatenia bacterium]
MAWIYLAELHYLQDQPCFPFQKAVSVTAITVARWCNYFYARLITLKANSTLVEERRGPLPAVAQEREAFVADCVCWLLENSITPQLFCLLLDDKPLPRSGRVAKFDHHDDTCCWVLNLSELEFAELQRVWKANNLPEDLFYPENQNRCLPYPGTDWKAKLLRVLGVQKCYTPRQWDVERSSDFGRS